MESLFNTEAPGLKGVFNHFMSSTNFVLLTNHISHQASEPTHLLPKGSTAHMLSSLVPHKEIWAPKSL